jgi:hypothetical protein
MSSTFYEPSIKAQLGRLWEKLEANSKLPREPMSAEEIERERTQAEHNTYAERCPMFAAARSAAIHRLVLPLEPNGTRPLVPIKDATNDVGRIFQWWNEWEDANIGVVVGRVGGLIALEVKDHASLAALMKPVVSHNEDAGQEVIDYPELGGGRVRFLRQSAHPIRQTEFQGWGDDPGKRKQKWFDSQKHPENLWLVWSYPSVETGLDAWDYKRKRIGSGLTVLAEGSVVPWNGSRIDDLMVVAPSGGLPFMPAALAPRLGHKRSNRVMQAVMAQRAADLRAQNAANYARESLLRQLEQEERGKALADRARADKLLADATAKGDDDA